MVSSRGNYVICKPVRRSRLPRYWRVWLATILLLCGVTGMCAGTEVIARCLVARRPLGPWWLLWDLGGLVCLLFVPALIVDHILWELRRAGRLR
jgi:hypothetical protein